MTAAERRRAEPLLAPPRRRRGLVVLVAALAASSLELGLGQPQPCLDWFSSPRPPKQGTALNGIVLPDVCFNATWRREHHALVIGDWGGVLHHGNGTMFPMPADKRSPAFPAFERTFVGGVDECAQQRVARQMSLRARITEPDYILNVGDNFYWGGLEAECGAPTDTHVSTGQWQHVFENVYTGPGIDGKQWLGVLGNHDYGGYQFNSAWDQIIAYTWGSEHSTGRWVTPAQYWGAKVHYPDFSVDYYFVDTNVFNAVSPEKEPGHNICGYAHNPVGATCGAMGPVSVEECPNWFARLWEAQTAWMENRLSGSASDWQIVVTHFPPIWGKDHWIRMCDRFGIDLILAGHDHQQQVWPPSSKENFLRPTAVVISGGGGGITAEGIPDPDGHDDMYGFMDLALTRDTIRIDAISHGGHLRSSTVVYPRLPVAAHVESSEYI